MGALFDDAFHGFAAEAFEAMETEAEGVVVEDFRFEHGVDDGDGFGADAVAFGVLEEGVDRVKAHGLVVDESAVEFGGAVGLQPAGGVGDEGKGNGVGFREAVEGEGADGLNDPFLNVGRDLAFGHAGFEGFDDGSHAFVGSFEGHRFAELIGFHSGEVGDDHGHAEDLFLEEGDAEGALENGLEGGVDVFDFFPSGPSVEVGVDEVAHDGAGADDGDLDRDIVKGLGLHDGEGGHLGAGLDLEGAHGVGAAEEGEGFRVAFGDAGEVHGATAAFANAEGVLHRGEHAEAEKIDLHDAQIFAVVFVPLQHGAIRHGGGLEGDDVVESVIAKDHSARMLTEVAGGVEDGVVEVEEGLKTGVGRGDSRFFDGGGEFHDLIAGVVIGHREFFGRAVAGGIVDLGGGAEIGEAVGDGFGEAEDFGHFPEGGAGAVGDDIGGHGSTARGVFLVNILNNRLPSFAGREVDIDVRPGLTVLGEEAFEEESAFDRIDTCYA